VPLLVYNFGAFGISLSYDVVDFGKRRAAVREGWARRGQAQESVEREKRK
jgi:hypothetical protein